MQVRGINGSDAKALLQANHIVFQSQPDCVFAAGLGRTGVLLAPYAHCARRGNDGVGRGRTLAADKAEGPLGSPYGELLEFAAFTQDVFVDHHRCIGADSQF